MNIPLLIVIAYIVVLYAVSWYSTKLNKGGYLGYLLAGRGFTTSIISTMVAGLAIGGASTIGVAEQAYKVGISAGWYNGAWAAGAVVVGLVMASKLRSLEVTTIPELFERYFDTSGRIVGVFGQVVIQMVITALQYVAGGAILAALMPEFFTFKSGMLVSAVTFIGITLVGGYWAAGLSNFINVIVIYIGIVTGAILSISKVGGFSGLSASLPANGPWFSMFEGVGMAMIIAWFTVMITQACSNQAVTQIAFAAKDGKSAKMGFIIGGLIIFPIGFLSAILGIVAAAKYPNIAPAMALPKVILDLDPVSAGLALSGLWAADVSTAVGLLLGSSTLIVNDIWKRFIQPDMSEKRQLMISRGIVLVISLLTYWMATSVLGIIKTLLIGLTLTTSYTTVLLFALFAPSLCKKGSAFWTVLVGILFLVAWQFVPAIRVVSHPIYLAWPISVLTFAIVYILDPRPAKIPSINEKTNSVPEAAVG
ncbi:sodium:solute symporter family protein [Dendrosporobacter sp. 1207_IL3150]|uniref:sodium:solute symporter family protein n=1 Tax=Dendrosporobacter sp. 1207_IL3150 TaxID=3084054 RepID=UPI002FDA596F